MAGDERQGSGGRLGHGVKYIRKVLQGMGRHGREKRAEYSKAERLGYIR